LADWITESEGDRCGAVAVVSFRYEFDRGRVRRPGDEVTGNLDCQRRIGAEVLAECQEKIVVDHPVNVDALDRETEHGSIGGQIGSGAEEKLPIVAESVSVVVVVRRPRQCR